jgi:hypothetical protein
MPRPNRDSRKITKKAVDCHEPEHRIFPTARFARGRDEVSGARVRGLGKAQVLRAKEAKEVNGKEGTERSYA